MNTSKYNACIAAAINTQIYAYSWYLDCVADDWGVLVYGDYEVVMPVPYLKLKRHLFLKRIYQPDFCQQLGVFSTNTVSKEIFVLFFKKLATKKPRYYNFNFYDSSRFLSDIDKLATRDNYELKLSNTYENLFASYSKNLKRNIAKAKKEHLIITDTVSVERFIALKKEKVTYRMVSRQYKKKSKLFNVLYAKGFAKVYGVFQQDELIAACFAITYKNKIINLSSATSETGKRIGAISFLFDALIKKNAESNFIFDFEGSMIPGVARFFKSFGADKITYKSMSD